MALKINLRIKCRAHFSSSINFSFTWINKLPTLKFWFAGCLGFCAVDLKLYPFRRENCDLRQLMKMWISIGYLMSLFSVRFFSFMSHLSHAANSRVFVYSPINSIQTTSNIPSSQVTQLQNFGFLYSPPPLYWSSLTLLLIYVSFSRIFLAANLKYKLRLEAKCAETLANSSLKRLI